MSPRHRVTELSWQLLLCMGLFCRFSIHCSAGVEFIPEEAEASGLSSREIVGLSSVRVPGAKAKHFARASPVRTDTAVLLKQERRLGE